MTSSPSSGIASVFVRYSSVGLVLGLEGPLTPAHLNQGGALLDSYLLLIKGKFLAL